MFQGPSIIKHNVTRSDGRLWFKVLSRVSPGRSEVLQWQKILGYDPAGYQTSNDINSDGIMLSDGTYRFIVTWSCEASCE